MLLLQTTRKRTKMKKAVTSLVVSLLGLAALCPVGVLAEQGDLTVRVKPTVCNLDKTNQCESRAIVPSGVFKNYQQDQEPVFCLTQQSVRSSESWGHCNSECLYPDCAAKEFGPENASERPNCKSQPSLCVFPFKFGGTEYFNCTSADTAEGSTDKWCATAVNSDNEMIEGMWGVCNEYYTSKEAEVIVDASSNNNGVSINVTLTQRSPYHPLVIKGVVKGAVSSFADGLHGFQIHTKNATGNACDAAEGHFNVKGTDITASGGEAKVDYSVGEEPDDSCGFSPPKLSLFSGQDNSILGKSAVVHEASLEQAAGARLACGEIKLKEEEAGEEIDVVLIVIIIFSIIALILIGVIIYLLWKHRCCCAQKGKYTPNPSPTPSPPEPDDKVLGDDDKYAKLPFIDSDHYTPDGSPGRNTNSASELCAPTAAV